MSELGEIVFQAVLVVTYVTYGHRAVGYLLPSSCKSGTDGSVDDGGNNRRSLSYGRHIIHHLAALSNHGLQI